VCAADATPSRVSTVRVTQTSLREGDIGLHRTVTVDSHRQRMDTSYKSPALASLEWTCFLLPLTQLQTSESLFTNCEGFQVFLAFQNAYLSNHPICWLYFVLVVLHERSLLFLLHSHQKLTGYS